METIKTIFSQPLQYCDPQLKESFHRKTAAALKQVAIAMGLQKGEFDIRSNKGGIGVSGEITLHTDRIYVQVAQSSSKGLDVLMRQCDGRKDYSGKQNRYAAITAFDDIALLADWLCALGEGKVTCRRWNGFQERSDVAHHKAESILTPALEQVRDQYEAGDVELDVFELAIAHTMHPADTAIGMQGSLF